MKLKDYIWFIKTSFSYMKGYNKFYILWHLPRALYSFRLEMKKDYR